MFCNNRPTGSWPKLVARLNTAETGRMSAADDPALTVPGENRSVRPATGDGANNNDPVLLSQSASPASALAFAPRPGPKALVSVIDGELTSRSGSIPTTPLLTSVRAPAGPGRHPAAEPGGVRQRSSLRGAALPVQLAA